VAHCHAVHDLIALLTQGHTGAQGYGVHGYTHLEPPGSTWTRSHSFLQFGFWGNTVQYSTVLYCTV